MGTRTILIVDDDKNIQGMLQVCLSGVSYKLEAAANGAEALSLVGREQPDLVLLDLAMPVMDGMTALTLIHDLPLPRRPRVIVMTAHGSVRTAIQAIRLGAADFLEKPFTPEDVRLSVASVLQERPLPAEEPVGGYASVLASIREALQAGTLASAEALLMRAGAIADDDPAFLNLAGVLHESRGRVQSAFRFYEKAAAKNCAYQPAQENLLRMVELRRTGRSLRKVALGDEHAPPERVRRGPIDCETRTQMKGSES